MDGEHARQPPVKRCILRGRVRVGAKSSRFQHRPFSIEWLSGVRRNGLIGRCGRVRQKRGRNTATRRDRG